MATIPLLFPDQPRGVAITPDGRFAYVTSASSQNVLVIDTASNTVVDTVTVTTAFAPTGIAVTPDGHFAYVAHSFTSSAVPRSIVSVIDTASNTVVATVPMDEASSGVAITPDGRFAYVTSADNVLVIDTARNTVVATVTVGSGPRGVAITPDGRFAYAANDSSGTVSVIDTASNTVVATVPTTLRGQGLAVSPSPRMGASPTLRVLAGALSRSLRRTVIRWWPQFLSSTIRAARWASPPSLTRFCTSPQGPCRMGSQVQPTASQWRRPAVSGHALSASIRPRCRQGSA